MSNKNTVSHDYMSDNRHFADAINYFIYDGRQVIRPEDLVEENVIEEIIIKNFNDLVTSQKIRDIVKRATIKSNGHVTFAILGIENQSEIHYAMPVRNMVYDSFNYASQVAKRAKELRVGKEKLRAAEFLSGFGRNDKLNPVITIVINWSDKRWDGPIRLTDMMPDMEPELANVIADYGINLIDPHNISSFEKFHTMLGDVLEFIKRQNEEDYLRNMVREKDGKWILDIDSVCAINTFTGANIPIGNQEEGEVDMCRATASLVEEGIEKGMEKGIEKGIEKGTDTVNRLNLILIDAGRMDDLAKAAKDPEYQKKLIKELLTDKAGE